MIPTRGVPEWRSQIALTAASIFTGKSSKRSLLGGVPSARSLSKNVLRPRQTGQLRNQALKLGMRSHRFQIGVAEEVINARESQSHGAAQGRNRLGFVIQQRVTARQ